MEHSQAQIVARMWSCKNSDSLLVGIQNGTATLEDEKPLWKMGKKEEEESG